MPIAIFGLIEQALRLVNNIIEGKPMNQRQAEALAMWGIFKPIIWPILPEEVKAEIVKLMDGGTLQ